MQESAPTPAPEPTPTRSRDLGIIWRLVQICLVLAASYLYFLFASIGGLLQRDRLMSNPHMTPMLETVLLGLGIGLCIGLALKDFSKGQIALHIDWPTLLINLLAAGVFCAVSISFAFQSIADAGLIRGPIRDATWLSPLLPFIWFGLALTTIVRSRQP